VCIYIYIHVFLKIDLDFSRGCIAGPTARCFVFLTETLHGTQVRLLSYKSSDFFSL